MSPELSGASDAGLDLIDDEYNAVLVGAFPQALKEVDGSGDVAPVSEDRFDDETGRIGGAADAGQELVQFLQGEGNGGFFVPAVAVGVGEGGNVNAAHQWREA
ncbi:hypothetical protein FQZ97_945920 [compost metagenome]